MIVIEIVTTTGKTIALTDNGVLSVMHKDFETAFAKINKEQAAQLAVALIQWSNEQPEPPSPKPYYGDDHECVPEN